MKTVNIILGILGVITFVFLLGLAGNVDWTDQVILHMSQEQYDTVKQHLTTQHNGNEPSEYEIAKWWAEHHK